MRITISPAEVIALDEHNLITPELREAVELTRGGSLLKYPAPELAEPEHALALLSFAARLDG